MRPSPLSVEAPSPSPDVDSSRVTIEGGRDATKEVTAPICDARGRSVGRDCVGFTCAGRMWGGPSMQQAVVGRGTELAAFERLLTRVSAGAAALVIAGEPGIGKTTVWEAGRLAAAARGYRVLASRPLQSESGLPLSAFGDLFSGLGADTLTRLPTPQRQAFDVAMLLAEPPDIPIGHRTLSVATTTLLRVLGQGQPPLLIAIDDAQWLDPSSAALLVYALRRAQDCPIRLLVTMRGAGYEPLNLGASLPPERLERIVLGPLSVAALQQLVRERTGQSFSRLALVKIQAVARGNPFYGLEIARALIRSGEPLTAGRPLPIPATLTDPMAERLAALPAATRAALLVAAVAVESPSLELLARVGIVEPRRAVDAAARDGIVTVEADHVRFSHPLLLSAVLSGADPARIRELHLSLARVGDTDEARAQHRAFAADGADADAADLLDRAATRTRLRGAPIAAGELFELASSLTPACDGTHAASRVQRAAMCYLEAGEAKQARTLLEGLLQSPDLGEGRAAALQLLGQVRARSHSFREALGLAVQALEAAGDDHLVTASVELDIAFFTFCLGDIGGVGPHAHASVRHAEAVGADAVLAEALAGLSMAEFWTGGGLSEARMARAIALEDPARSAAFELRPSVVRALMQLWIGNIDAALEMLLAFRVEMIEGGQDTSLPFLSLHLVLASLWRGDLSGAAQFAEECWDTATLTDEPVGRALALTVRSLVHALGGPFELARREAADALALFQQSQFTIYTTWPLWALGFLELSSGNARRVDELLQPLSDAVTSLALSEPILGVFLPDEIEALARLGELERAQRYMEWLERGAAALDRPWERAVVGRCRGLIAAAAGDMRMAIAHVDGAIGEHQRLSMPFELGRTLLVKGQIHRRVKEKRRASDALEKARSIFEAVGAPLWTARATAELARIGLRPAAPMELTQTELRIAELAASGMTNRLIAKAAFVAPKTVDNVLGRVYRKLGIASRAELGATMASTSNPATGQGARGLSGPLPSPSVGGVGGGGPAVDA